MTGTVLAIHARRRPVAVLGEDGRCSVFSLRAAGVVDIDDRVLW